MTGLRVWLHPSSRTVKLSLVVRRWPTTKLHSSALGRTASIVRNGRHVANGAHFNSRGRESANRRFAAGTWTADAHIHAAPAMIAGHVGRVRGRLLGGERGAFPRPAEAERSGTLPRQNVAIHVGNSHDRVVEGSLHVAQSMRNVLALLLLERFLLAFFLRCGCAARCCWFSHEKRPWSLVVGRWSLAKSLTNTIQAIFLNRLGRLTTNTLGFGRRLMTNDRRRFLRFCRRLLLLSDGTFARAFAGARVGMSTLSADGQVTAVTEAAIGSDFDETLDVHRNFLTEVAFH